MVILSQNQTNISKKKYLKDHHSREEYFRKHRTKSDMNTRNNLRHDFLKRYNLPKRFMQVFKLATMIFFHPQHVIYMCYLMCNKI